MIIRIIIVRLNLLNKFNSDIIGAEVIGMTILNHKEGVVITVTGLEQNLGKYMDFVENQNEVVITINGKK